MYNIRKILLLIVSCGLFASCELDEFDEPNAELYGSVIDAETGELVQQDIIRGGVLELREFGYDPVSPQFLIFENDGSYRNSRLFANTYSVEPLKTNFVPVASQEVNISGSTQLNFEVIPYIRVKDATISKNGNKIIATFSLEQNSINNVKKIGLYAHPDPHVGEPMRVAQAEQDINAVVNSGDVYTLEIDTTTDPDFEAGKKYFFRVGALIDEPEARFNYAAPVDFDL